MGSCLLAYLATVFIEGHIAHPVDSVLDGPMITVEGKDTVWISHLWAEAGNSVDRHEARVLPVQIGDGAFEAEDLGGIGELGVSD